MKLLRLLPLYIIAQLLLSACNEDDKEIDPSIKTVSVTATSAATVIARGSIDEIGSFKVIDYGFEYSSQKKSLGDQPVTGAFEAEIQSSNSYSGSISVRAYLLNEKGIVYGQPIQVTFPTISVTSITPVLAKAGDLVTILGNNFSPNPQDNKVTFLETQAVVKESSTTRLVVEVPSNVTNSYYYSGVRVTVKVGYQTAVATENFRINPSVTDFSPKSGNVGTLVTLSGNNFLYSTFSVIVNGITVGASVASNTTASFTIPSGIKQDKLKFDFLTNGVTTNIPGEFTILAPEIASYSPKKGIGGTLVTITGKNFTGINQYYSTGDVKIKLGNVEGSIQSVTPTEIKFIVPKEVAVGTHTLSLSTPIYTISATDQFTLATPKITSLSPATAPRGTYVTITGENFGVQNYYDTSTVLIGTTQVSIYSWTDTSIRVFIPTTMAAGTYKVIINNGGQSTTLTDGLVITN